MSVIEARRAETPSAGQPHGDLFAAPLVDVERLADGGMILRSPVRLNAPPRCLKCLARTLGERSAGARLPRRARRRARGPGLAHAHLRRGARASPRRRAGAPRSRALARAADPDPGRERHRPRRRRACRHACRHPGGAGLDRLCAAQQGLRQAALHPRADRAAARLHRRPVALRRRGDGGRLARRGDRREPPGARHDGRSPTFSPRCPTSAVERANAAVGPDTRRQDPVHLGLDRTCPRA